jgi:hypothetical protein
MRKAKGRCPLALSHQENDFPGPLIFLEPFDVQGLTAKAAIICLYIIFSRPNYSV